MFSAERMTRCQPEYLLDGEEVRLERRFHAAWITLLKRGRPGVVEAVSDRLCEEGEELRLRMVCRGPTQQRWVLEDGQRDLCQVTVL